MSSQIILDIGAEGGSLTVFGEKNAAGEWKFGDKREETILCDAEDDPNGTDLKHSFETTGFTLTFGEAIARLDRYPWVSLYPLDVHPEFLDAVLLEVRMRGGKVEEKRWREALAKNTPWREQSLEASPVPVPLGGGVDAVASSESGYQIPTYQIGMIVEIISKPEWSPGKIVHKSGHNHLHIVFRDSGEKVARIFVANAPTLRVADIQRDPVLDHLPPPTEKDGRWYLDATHLSLASAKLKFLRYFPAGFSDSLYLKNERDYKIRAHNQFHRLFVQGDAQDLLEKNDIAGLVKRCMSGLSGVGELLSPFESAAFHDAMNDHDAARTFFSALLRVLKAERIYARDFEFYLDAVSSLPAERGSVATWPVATIFPYITDPTRHMFLKPLATKAAAAALGFDLQYNVGLNWVTYASLLRMGHIYLERLREMCARDFVDVQSFIFVVGGGYD